MLIEEITIRVDAQAARAYRAASEEERLKLDLLMSLRLREALQPVRPLKEVMDDIGTYAETQGMTPALLTSLLHEV